MNYLGYYAHYYIHFEELPMTYNCTACVEAARVD